MKKGMLYWMAWAIGMVLIGSSIKISEEIFSTKPGNAETMQSIVTLAIILSGLAIIIMSMRLYDRNIIDEKRKQLEHDETYREIDKMNKWLIIGSVAAGVIFSAVFFIISRGL